MSKPMRLWAPQLHELGYGVLAVDLRNHGASPDVAGGAVTYGMSEADDVAAAVTYLQDTAATKGIDPERIVLYGGSMGAATVLNTAARGLPGVVGVISDSSYASLSFQAHLDGHKQGYPGFVVDWVLARMDDLAPAPPTRSRPDLALAEMQVPVLLAHCSNDARIAVASYDRLVALAPSGTTTWSHPCPTGLSADHHLDGWMSASYNSTVSAFLGRL
jgi:pimeloyl-ACP methyl ester carboxylesterase